MQKFTQFLEKNAEWLALGFGGLFLLYMVYAYVFSSPVGVQMGGQTLSLGEIDRYILNNQGRALERAMDPNLPAPDLSFPPLAQNFQARMARQGQQALAFDNHYPLFPPQNLNIQATQGPELEIQVVKQLPTLPAPTLAVRVVDGQPTDELAIRKGNSAVALPPDPAPGQPVMGMNQQGLPQGPAVIPVQIGQPGSFKREDRLWVSLMYTVSMADIAAAFDKENVFQAAPGSQTAFLQVQLEREEKLPNGEWGNRTLVPLLKNAIRPPMPPEEVYDAQQAEPVNQFVNWAAQNALEILKPAFYPVLAGTNWLPPNESDVLLAQETEEQMRARLQALQEQRQRERDERRRTAQQRRSERDSMRGGDGPRRGRPPRGGDEYDYAPIDRDRPARSGAGDVRFEQVAPPRRPPQGYPPRGYPGYPPEGYDPMMEEYPMEDLGMGQPQPGQSFVAQVPQEITQRFQPDPIIGDIELWVHDDTVEAGKTYRYRVRYRMANPILGWFGVAEPPELQNKVYVDSAWSDWSQNIRMDSLVQYFVSGSGLGAQSTVRFDVFKWADGFWQMETFSNLGPGDLVGEKRGNIDYGTGMTIVDIREDPRRDRHVVLVDPDGNLVTRNLRADQNSAEYRELYRKAQEDKARQAAMPPQADARTPMR